MSSGPTIDERLARLEDVEREISDLRRELGERLADVMRGTAVFDAATRERVRRLRELEADVAAERRDTFGLVEVALDVVHAQRNERGAPERRPLWLEPVVLPDAGVPAA